MTDVIPQPGVGAATGLAKTAGLDTPASFASTLDDFWSPERERVDPAALSWPASRFGSLIGTFLLFASMTSPFVAAGTSAAAMVIAVPAIAGIALVARWLSHSTVLGTGPRAFGRRALEETPTTLAVTVMLALVAFVAGIPAGSGTLAVTTVLILMSLVVAASLAAVETRVRLDRRRVFFIGTDVQRQRLAQEFLPRPDAQLVGALSFPTSGIARVSRPELVRHAVQAGATMVVLNRDAMTDQNVLAATSDLHRLGRRVRPLARFYEEAFGKVALDDLAPEWFLGDVAEIHRVGMYRYVRRAAECTSSGVLLMLSAPLLPIIAALVKLSSPGPVFFQQERVGRDGVSFRLTKFRTMTVRPAGKTTWATDELGRVTAIGRVLRRFRLDELPQLVDVLAGRMSLVGPRPEQVPLVAELNHEVPYYGARHVVRPGITGWAQVHAGYCGGIEGAKEKLAYDLFYVKHQGLRLDLAIVASTARTVLRGRGT